MTAPNPREAEGRIGISGDDKISELIAEVRKSLKGVSDQTKEAKAATDDYADSVLTAGERVALLATGWNSAIDLGAKALGLATSLGETLREAAQHEAIEGAFEQSFQRSSQVLAQLRSAASGRVTDPWLEQLATQAQRANIGVSDLAKVLEVASKASVKTGGDIKDITETLINDVIIGASDSGLEQLGIVKDLGVYTEQYAASMGIAKDEIDKTTQSQAALKMVTTEVAKEFENVRLNESTIVKLDRISAQWERIKDEGKKAAAGATIGVLDFFFGSDAPANMDAMLKGLDELEAKRAAVQAKMDRQLERFIEQHGVTADRSKAVLSTTLHDMEVATQQISDLRNEIRMTALRGDESHKTLMARIASEAALRLPLRTSILAEVTARGDLMKAYLDQQTKLHEGQAVTQDELDLHRRVQIAVYETAEAYEVLDTVRLAEIRTLDAVAERQWAAIETEYAHAKAIAERTHQRELSLGLSIEERKEQIALGKWQQEELETQRRLAEIERARSRGGSRRTAAGRQDRTVRSGGFQALFQEGVSSAAQATQLGIDPRTGEPLYRQEGMRVTSAGMPSGAFDVLETSRRPGLPLGVGAVMGGGVADRAGEMEAIQKGFDSFRNSTDSLTSSLQALSSVLGHDLAEGLAGLEPAVARVQAAVQSFSDANHDATTNYVRGSGQMLSAGAGLAAGFISNEVAKAAVLGVMETGAALASYPDVVGMTVHGLAAATYFTVAGMKGAGVGKAGAGASRGAGGPGLPQLTRPPESRQEVGNTYVVNLSGPTTYFGSNEELAARDLRRVLRKVDGKTAGVGHHYGP